MEQLMNEIRESLSQQLGIDEKFLRETNWSDNIENDLNISGVDAISFLMRVEERTKVEIDQNKVYHTLRDVGEEVIRAKRQAARLRLAFPTRAPHVEDDFYEMPSGHQ